MREIWKDAIGYENLYQVSNLGRIKNKKNKLLKITYDIKGYARVWLYKNKTYFNERINRLVAKAFIPNPDNLPQVNHIDGDKTHNNINNLEWCTASENIRHAYRTGLLKKNKKVYQYDKNNNLINEFFSQNQASIITKINQANISLCTLGKRKTAGGYIWKCVKEMNK